MNDFTEYQVRTRETAVYPAESVLDALIYTILGLSNEAGEVAGKLKKLIRGDELPDGPEWEDVIADEIGDVLWYLARVADEMNINLAVIAENNLQKLESRKERNVLKGSGDKR
jgi:NTP pyrophosphatase (non-canonical NTP hydrolase)